MNKIAIIPARSGSKGLVNKNIIDLAGKPLLAYSIDAAIKSNVFKRVIVSTDSKEYGQIAKKYGAEVIYRGEELSNDTASTFDVINDLLSKVENNIDYFVLLQPTSPLRNYLHVLESIKLFEKNYDKYDFLVSMQESEHAKVLVNKIEADLSLKYFDTDFSTYRRQNFKDYSPNGAIFMAKPDKYLKQKHFFGTKSIAYIMDKKFSIDIDDEIDYELAKIIIGKTNG